jgi:DNA-3-methyladenine glycosylase
VDPASADARLELVEERPLGRAFYSRAVLEVARALLGRTLVHDTSGGRLAGIIVEVEAYRGADDPASHAFGGRTPRNAVMFGPPGHAYVYFTYGMHHCLNVVTGREGAASAVLIRAIEPVSGIERMRRLRGIDGWDRLGRGPGCVARALDLDLRHNGLDFTASRLWIAARAPRRRGRTVAVGPRIGIRRAVGRPWRFFLAGHPCVSGPRGLRRSPGTRRVRRVTR